MGDCKHDLACRRCGASIGAIGLAAADAEPDPEFDAVLDRIGAELGQLLVSSVTVHTDGAHERVSVWLQGMHVGSLLVGEGHGQRLRMLLLSEDIVARARVLVQHWHDQDGFNSSIVDDLMSAVTFADRMAKVEEEVEA